VHGVIVKNQLDSWREGFYRANTTAFKCLTGQYPLVTNCLFKAKAAEDFVFHEELGNVSDGMLLTCAFAKYDAYVSKVVTGYWNNDHENASTLNRPDPVLLVDTAIRESRYYTAFCRKNGIFRRGMLLLWLKRSLTVLIAADQGDFAHVLDASEMKESFSPPMIAVLWLFDRLKLVRLFMMGLALLRRLNKSWVAWRES